VRGNEGIARFSFVLYHGCETTVVRSAMDGQN
jgi:hypothetical protein